VYGVRRIVAESYPILLVCTLIGLSGGFMLGASFDLIAKFPEVLAMFVVINATGGNLGCILGARLSSALHLGTLEPKLHGQRVLVDNLTASAIQSLLVFSIVAAVFFSFTRSLVITAAFFVSGILLSVVVMIATVASAFVSYRGGLDPDNVVIPIMTAITDVMGILILLLSMRIMGA
jgi:mgtE-like transporter